jgi:shikimate dehydrogenase
MLCAQIIADLAMTQRLHFIGVATAGSSILRLFPRWAELLGLEADIAGRDIPLGAEPVTFRAAVEEIAAHDEIRGALVTTHKVDVFQYAGDLFDELDEHAQTCREISCISKRGDALVGHAKDPLTAGRALDEMLGPAYWRGQRAQALCLGAGGAGTAITVRFLTEPNPPARVVATDRDSARLERLRQVHAKVAIRTDVDYVIVEDGRDTDALVEALPPRSLIVNATGLGKDQPGSPITRSARFPPQAVVWELNYRGELEFLAQARRQAGERGLRVYDGWRNFLPGSTEVIAEVFDLELSGERFERLAEAAAPFRPSS